MGRGGGRCRGGRRRPAQRSPGCHGPRPPESASNGRRAPRPGRTRSPARWRFRDRTRTTGSVDPSVSSRTRWISATRPPTNSSICSDAKQVSVPVQAESRRLDSEECGSQLMIALRRTDDVRGRRPSTVRSASAVGTDSAVNSVRPQHGLSPPPVSSTSANHLVVDQPIHRAPAESRHRSFRDLFTSPDVLVSADKADAVHAHWLPHAEVVGPESDVRPVSSTALNGGGLVDTAHLVCPRSCPLTFGRRSQPSLSGMIEAGIRAPTRSYDPFLTNERATLRRMARPYEDPVEVVTAPIPAESPFIPSGTRIIVGAVAPASPDPIPIVLLPGFEYRLREWRHPTTHENHDLRGHV